MAETEAIYQSYVTYKERVKSGLIELRDEQKEAVKAAKSYFEKSKSNQRFLWNAKMRFGKTFCAMELAIEMGESEVDPKGKKDSKPINRVLIITHRPVVQDGFAKDLKKLQESLKAKGQLKREWKFGTKWDDDDHANLKDLEKSLKNENHPYAFFASMQYLVRSTEVGGDNDEQLKKDILNMDWDLVVIDEAHEGIIAERGSVVIAKLTKERTKMLYMSGTPFNLLEGTKGFSEDQIYSWDYIEEQKKKEEWPIKYPLLTNPYQELPKMNIFAFDMGKLVPGKDYKKGDMFSFKELFSTFCGRPEKDIVDGKQYKASPEEIGKFIHEKDVKKFLELMYKGDEKTNYPYTKQQYQENFKHTLWIVPGVKAAKALEVLLDKDDFWGSTDEDGIKYFKVVNVAGNNDDAEGLDDLSRVKDAIANHPYYTITLSCARLTTGVTVPQWTAVFYMKGSADSSPATYMQTIFRVQSPHVYEENGEKRMKANCYVFDFAPGRSLKVVAEIAKFSRKTKTSKRKANIITQKDEDIIKDFTKYCPIWQPVVAKEGSSLKPVSTEKIIEALNKVYIENIVKNGFDDYNIYLDDEILKLTDDVIQKTKEIVENIPGDDSKGKKGSTEISGSGGLTTSSKPRTPQQKKTAKEKWEKEVEDGKTTESFEDWLARKDQEAEEDKRLKEIRKLIHAITKRIPLLMFGAEVDDEKIGININNITERIDDDSWTEFMPKGATKEYFEKIKHCYDDSMFRKAGTMIRDMARETEDMHIEERIAKIAEIFGYFKNPDKETVLTPWPVVNMHMSETLGGYCFFDETFKRPNMIPALDANGNEIKDKNGDIKLVETRFPRIVGEDRKVTNDIFNNIDILKGESHTKILEINSKTGLYPLYVAYSLYRPLLDLYKDEHAIDDPDNIAVSEERAIWNMVIKNNIYVICNTDMAARITYRTLAGYNPIDGVDTSTISKEHYVKGMHIVSDRLVEKTTNNFKELVKAIKSQNYWERNNIFTEMKFDAIVGNPPYQIMDGGNGGSSTPIYNTFINLALGINPIYLSLIVPARWTTGGKGLKEFRTRMIRDKHITCLYDFLDSKRCFPNVEIEGGVCFFLRESEREDKCQVITIWGNGHIDKSSRCLQEYLQKTDIKNNDIKDVECDIFIRDNNAISILKKVIKKEGFESFKEIVHSRNYYGLTAFPNGASDKLGKIRILGLANRKRVWKHVDTYSSKSPEFDNNMLSKYKVFASKADGAAGQLCNPVPARIIGVSEYGAPNSICTETFLAIGPFDSEIEAKNVMDYMKTKFFRFLVGIRKLKNMSQETYSFVPNLDFNKKWTDETLYKEFGLEKSEIDYIESMIAAMK